MPSADSVGVMPSADPNVPQRGKGQTRNTEYVPVPGTTFWIRKRSDGEYETTTTRPPDTLSFVFVDGRYYPDSVEAMDTEDPQIVYYNGVQGTLYRQTFVP